MATFAYPAATQTWARTDTKTRVASGGHYRMTFRHGKRCTGIFENWVQAVIGNALIMYYEQEYESELGVSLIPVW